MPEPWQVVSSVLTYQDRWLTVRSDNCVTPDGKLIAPYHVLEYPDWVIIVALTSDFQIVLARQYRHGAGQVLTELPAGAVELGEASAEAAARRELREETGFTSDEFLPLNRVYTSPAKQNNVEWSFLALNVRQTEAQHLDSSEEIDVITASFRDFVRDVQRGAIPLHGLHVASVHAAVYAILKSQRSDLAPLRDILRQDLLSQDD